MKETEPRRVDQTALKVNQALIIVFLLLAFILDSPVVAAAVSVVMLLGTAAPPLALFKQFYQRILRPAGLLKARIIPDNPEPHRFAQGFGGVVVAGGVLALMAGQVVIGWALVWLVVALAALNLFAGFCAGCFLYYQLNRLGIPGFDRQPITRG